MKNVINWIIVVIQSIALVLYVAVERYGMVALSVGLIALALYNIYYLKPKKNGKQRNFIKL